MGGWVPFSKPFIPKGCHSEALPKELSSLHFKAPSYLLSGPFFSETVSKGALSGKPSEHAKI